MAKRWKVAICGVGGVGEWHMSVLKRSEEAELVAVCDIKPENAQKAINKHGLHHLPVYTDLKKMLDETAVEAVHIATPSGAHMDPAITIMEAGRHVICEKPIEIQLPKIDRMIETAIRKNVRLAGIFQNRWNRANRAIADAAHAGRFGRITYAGSHTPWYRTDQYYRDGGWRGTWALDGGGAIMNQSVHAIDLIQWICGPIRQVSAYGSSLIHPEIEVEDTLAASVLFENGAYGVIMGATSMWPGGPVRIEVGGEKGTAVSENGLQRWRFADEKEEESKAFRERVNAGQTNTTGGGANPQDVPQWMHAENIKHIYKSWEAGKDAETAGPEARKAVAIILALYESAKKGGAPVKVS